MFPALEVVRKDLAPLRLLWDVSAQYATQRGAWWGGKLNAINSERMQESVHTWGKVLAQLKKVTDAHPEGGAGELRRKVAEEVESIREYLPIIASLRTRGLEKRHFQEMSRKLGINIDPAQLTLKELQTHNLAQGRALEAIKGVSEVASKENSIKLAVDGIEKEVREIGFATVPYKDTKVKIIKSAEVVLQRFEDCLVKIQSLKGNPFAKPQAERIAKNERELKVLQGNFEGWEQV
jgi:dynein heavy chain, axonemal